MQQQRHTIGMVRPKIEKYCAYQERCQQEVVLKLKSYLMSEDDINQVLYELVKKNFINEERFAQAYARGKSRQKKWGKTKIIFELKKRKISEYCIKKALQEIDEDDYESATITLAEKYFGKLKDHLTVTKKRKTITYLIGKGYDYEFSKKIVETINTKP